MNGLRKMTKGVQLSRENSEDQFLRVCLELGMQRSQLTVRSILSRRAIFREETQRFLQISNVFGLVFPLTTKKDKETNKNYQRS